MNLTKPCLNCGTEMTKRATESVSYWNDVHKCCSRRCSSLYCVSIGKIKGFSKGVCTNPNGRPRTRINMIAICQTCKEEFGYFPDRSDGKYCTRKCYFESQRKFLSASGAEQREAKAKSMKGYHTRVRAMVIQEMGARCVCCGETEIEFLTIDHIHGKGTQDRKKNDLGGSKFYAHIRRLLRANQDVANYVQILCYNCNCTKGRIGYCPHEKTQSAIAFAGGCA